MRVKWPNTMQRISPPVALHAGETELADIIARYATELADRAEKCPGFTSPFVRHTNTVSIIDEPVPWIWIDPPISAGQGKLAEQVRPASRMATPMA